MELAWLEWPEAALVAVALISLLAGYWMVRLAQSKARGSATAAPPAAPVMSDDWRDDTDRRIDALAAEVAELREQLSQLRAQRGVSPQYSEAMSLARSGLSAQDIAARCGISVAEAELVRALGGRSSE